jgi:hypothetical protein
LTWLLLLLLLLLLRKLRLFFDSFSRVFRSMLFFTSQAA